MMHILLAVSVANAMLADKDQHPHLSLDDILKKYEHHDTEKMESKFDDAGLHDTVLDMHQKTADMFDSIPTLEPVMHPASPLTHHDRLSAVLKGMDHDDDDSAAPAEDAPKDDAKDVPADPFAIPDDAKAPTAAEDPLEPAAPADADAPPADAAPAEGADADAPKDAPADADAPPAEKEEKEAAKLSPEKAAKLATVEKTLLSKMGKSLKMMVMLHMMVKPMEKKLAASMAQLPEGEKADAQAALDHIQNLDKLTGGALGLMEGMKKAAHGTAEEKKTALLKMIMGMATIEKGVKENLAGMKKMKMAHSANPAKQVSSKLHMLVAKMQAKVDAELADPARKDDPLVAVDVKMLDKIKKSVKKSEALMMVGAIAMKKAKTDEERKKIQTSVKGAMQKVMGQMKEDMSAMKEEAMVALKAKMEKEEAEKAKKADALPDDSLPDAPKDEKSDGELNGLLDKIDAIPDSLLQKKAKETAAKDVPHLRAH
jgi:hypothetical protein